MENKNYTEEILYKSKITGKYYHDKERAEKAGFCECGNIKKSGGYIYCDQCNEKKKKEDEEARINQFKTIKGKKWDDSVKCVYDQNTDEWFNSLNEFTDHYFEENIYLEEARLIEGTPRFLREVEEDYWDEDIYEDYEFPKEFNEALEKLNEIARKTIGAYFPDGSRIIIL